MIFPSFRAVTLSAGLVYRGYIVSGVRLADLIVFEKAVCASRRQSLK